jgi:hypothetical protein
MNTTQLGITAGSIFVVSAVSALLFNLLKSKPSEPRRFSTDEYIYNLNPSYRTNYDADRDPTMPEYEPFKTIGYRGGTRCTSCHTRLRYTRRK